MSQEIEAEYDLPQIGHWEGAGLSGSNPNQFIVKQGAQIDALWAEEAQKARCDLLCVGAYREVTEQLGRVGNNVIEACLDMVNRGSGEQKDLGEKVIVHQLLHSVFRAIDLINNRFPGMVDEEDLFSSGLTAICELIKQQDYSSLSFTQRIHQKVHHEGRQLAGEQCGFSIVDDTIVLPISQFIENWLVEKGYLPSADKLTELFNLDLKSAKRFINRWELGDGRSLVAPTMNRSCDLGEDKFDSLWEQSGSLASSSYNDPQAEAERNELKAKISSALETLPQKRGYYHQLERVLQLRFGLEDDKERTLVEVGQEFGLSGERIRSLEIEALGALRRPNTARKLRDYLE